MFEEDIIELCRKNTEYTHLAYKVHTPDNKHSQSILAHNILK